MKVSTGQSQSKIVAAPFEFLKRGSGYPPFLYQSVLTVTQMEAKVRVVLGGPEVSRELVASPFDHIAYTGPTDGSQRERERCGRG